MTVLEILLSIGILLMFAFEIITCLLIKPAKMPENHAREIIQDVQTIVTYYEKLKNKYDTACHIISIERGIPRPIVDNLVNRVMQEKSNILN